MHFRTSYHLNADNRVSLVVWSGDSGRLSASATLNSSGTAYLYVSLDRDTDLNPVLASHEMTLAQCVNAVHEFMGVYAPGTTEGQH